ncbi:MAG: Trk system potassium transporter TrkA, partial [Deltaproteobacteria bacterium]|nr:Trk system potassium transporter TrkA [Deltaproteobacteria bacterium]
TVAMETSDIADKPLKDINFPSGAVIGGIVRNTEVIIPNGDTIIKPNDRVVVFALRKSVPKVEKALMVKPDYF